MPEKVCKRVNDDIKYQHRARYGGMTIKDKKKQSARSSSKQARLPEQMSGSEQHIEEHGQTNQAVDSTAIHRLIVDNANEAIIIAQDGMLRFANTTAVQFSGYSHDELMSMPFTDFIHPKDRQMVLERHQQRLSGKKVPGVYAIRIVDKKGKVKWVEINSVLFTWQGRPATLNFLDDITERRQMETRLRASEKRFRELANWLPQMVFELDKKGNFTFVNHQTLESLGFAPDDLSRGLNFLQLMRLMASDNCLMAEERFQRVLEGESFGPTNYTGLREDGSTFSVDMYTRPTMRRNSIVGARGIAVDVTKRKQAEERLFQSEQRYRLLAEHIADVIWTIDMTMRPTYMSPSITNLLGYTVDEAMAMTMTEVFSPESFELAMEIFRKAMIDEGKKTRRKPDKPRTVELELLHKDGSTVPVEVTFTFIRDSNKELSEILSVVRNITHRKQTEAQFLAYQEQLRSLASELSLAEERERHRMATEVHHRLSQPLVICHMKLGALVESLPSSSSTDHLREIQTIIRQLINETNSIAFEFSSPLLYQFGLEAAVEELIEQTQKQHGIRFNFEHDEQAKLLGNDTRVLLYQTVRELLVNIRKHAQARHVKVCMKGNTNDFCVVVEDDGVGFDVSGIYPKRKKVKGFGLFSIRERLKYIGGQIEIKSKPGQGTQVTISVPLK